MKTLSLAALVLLTAFLCPVASADIVYTQDLWYDWTGYGGTEAEKFEIWEVGSEIKDGKLYFSILQDLPHDGALAKDSYGDDAHVLSPGDLVIAVGTADPFDAASARYGVALTSHANVVEQKYPGETWDPVQEGLLYTKPVFATGSYEEYQQWMIDNVDPNDVYPPHNPPFLPDDQDGNNLLNSYMTLIKAYDSEVSGHSSVTWATEIYDDPVYGPWTSYRITGYVDLDQLGLEPGMAYSLFISSECGNDGAVHSVPVPEPGAFALLAVGLSALVFRKRS